MRWESRAHFLGVAAQAMRREQVRMRSRQTYFYGVGFHLTGDPRLLALARDGVAWIRQHALDRDTGSAASWFEGERSGPISFDEDG